MALACCCLLMVVAVALQRTATPAPLPCRPLFADIAACLVSGWIFALTFCLSGRPLLALALATALLLGLRAVNAAKMRALRGEPLVITDLALAWQVLRFPQLYVPFLPRSLFWGGVVGAVLLTSLCLATEGIRVLPVWWLAAMTPLLVYGLLRSPFGDGLAKSLLAVLPVDFAPSADAQRYGPLGAALLHAVWHLAGRCGQGVRQGIERPAVSPPWPASVLRSDTICRCGRHLPHIFLVQAESFCDPRPFSSAVPQDVLATWDELCAQGMSGSLGISAFGAYTMRTEYAILSGQPASTLGSDAFHPYLGAARYPTWSLVWHLRSLGYRTVCIHPFYREFFYRHKAIPHLGFEKFLSLENFPNKETCGPYVSDACVARAMLDLLDASEATEPVFCFAISMENHGPWLPGRLQKAQTSARSESPFGAHSLLTSAQSAAPEAELKTASAIPGLDPATCRYLVHLRHADAMLGMLRDGLRQAGRPAVLGWYGDHLPNLPALVPQGARATPYVLWRTDTMKARRRDMLPEELGGYLLSPL